MVCALDSGPHVPGLSPGWDTVLCSWARHCASLHPGVKMATSKLNGLVQEGRK